MDPAGCVLETPSEPAGSSLAGKVRVDHYPVREAAGLIWAYLGDGETPPFPAFGFTELGPDQVLARAALVHCNWIQALEANLDSSHLSILHGYWMAQVAGRLEGESKPADVQSVIALDSAPVYEIDSDFYGLQAAAVRNLPDGGKHVRLTQWVFPWYLLVPRPRAASEHVITFVPVDAEHTLQWYIDFDRSDPLDGALFSATEGMNLDNFFEDGGGPATNWLQDRVAMENGHWSGLSNLLWEDFVVQESMGPIVDRSREHQGVGDQAIIQMRKALLAAVKAHQQDGAVFAREDGGNFGQVTAPVVTVGAGVDWREALAKP
jgi:phthalate 4,5-dioxygenase oxygenase subunit